MPTDDPHLSAESHRRHTDPGVKVMEFGASIFFTDYSITPAALAVAMEERGFDSLWAAEHSHIPVPRRTPAPGGGELAKRYYDVMDPFVTLTAAAAVTKKLKLGTGVCLVIQRDTIQTAKLVASIDQVSGGRFLFGIGGGWNAEEIENHGTQFATRMKKMREQIEAMKEIWTKDKAEYHGDLVSFPTMMTWPKPVQKPYPPILLGGAFPWAARRAIRYGDGWYPNASSGNPDEYLPKFKEMAREAGRDPNSLELTLGGAPEDPDPLKHIRDLGVARVNFPLMSEKADEILPRLDRIAALMRQVGN
jgi:probable F420-dependent oxidoreductase